MVVASKVPLPNYRPDLDDKRPQREVTLPPLVYQNHKAQSVCSLMMKFQCISIVQVVLPLSLQRRVEGLLQEHLDRQQLNLGKANEGVADSQPPKQTEELPDESSDSFLDGSVMEKVLQRRSMRMRNMQRAWQVLLESSLPRPSSLFI